MHILFLSHYYTPEVNAPASRTSEHCKRWRQAGHQVTVITCAPNCPTGIVFPGYQNRWRSTETIDGCDVIRVWTWLAPNKGFLWRVINFVSFLFRAAWEARTVQNVDLIVATSPQLFCGWAGAWSAWWKNVPFVLEVRDLWPESIVAVGAMRPSPLIRVLEWLERKLYQSADHIVTVGDDYRTGIVQRGVDPRKISVTPNGVDLTKFARVDGTAIREEQHTGNCFVCGYVGTVGMAHGLEVVLEAAALLNQAGRDDVQFWIVGDGARKDELETLARQQDLKNVRFLGLFPKERMSEVLSACDAALVHLRGAELFSTVMPSKVFEYMALNLPIVMGVRGQAADIVEEARAGVEMIPDQPQSLLDGIEAIRQRGTDSFSGRNYVARQFNRDQLAAEMLQKLCEVAAKKDAATPVAYRRAG